MCNQELRETILENGLYKRYAKAKRNSFLQSKGESFFGETLIEFECALSVLPNWYEIEQECERLTNRSYQRIKRLKARVKKMLENGSCLFLTLTFNEETLANTTMVERRALVSSYLKKAKCQFIGNIDFGKKNEREHYHAIVNCEKVDYTAWHQNGAIKGEKVHLKSNTETKIARYIDKLSLHALKESTFNNRMLYSK